MSCQRDWNPGARRAVMGQGGGAVPGPRASCWDTGVGGASCRNLGGPHPGWRCPTRPGRGARQCPETRIVSELGDTPGEGASYRDPTCPETRVVSELGDTPGNRGRGVSYRDPRRASTVPCQDPRRDTGDWDTVACRDLWACRRGTWNPLLRQRTPPGRR